MGPEFILQTEEFVRTLNRIGTHVSDNLTEDEVQMVFLNEGYFKQLGYEDIGENLRSELTLPDNTTPDYITSGRNNRTVVYEFKAGGRKLFPRFEKQLFGYLPQVGAEYGVLTNGDKFRIYDAVHQPEPRELLNFSLSSAESFEASTLILYLGYWSIKEHNLKSAAEWAAKELLEMMPDDLQPPTSEAQIEIFAKYLSEQLMKKYI